MLLLTYQFRLYHKFLIYFEDIKFIYRTREFQYYDDEKKNRRNIKYFTNDDYLPAKSLGKTDFENDQNIAFEVEGTRTGSTKYKLTQVKIICNTWTEPKDIETAVKEDLFKLINCYRVYKLYRFVRNINCH